MSTPLQQFEGEVLREFDEKIKAPDITNSDFNSPKIWMFEGYIACKKEAKSFLLDSLARQRGMIKREIEKQKERFKCAACDGAKCEHTHCCTALSEVEKSLMKNRNYDP